ncbi:glycosyltransferase family 4 protein [Amedibacillus dolichus]|uniref:glycosyltransferase family 4 protein n=1 Tax=Amedibacillus dolichus TaxID=31971 RepID=UPI00241D9F75|nr:glycosyltransferase family 4 protein [Amedibacillus dolichus]
MQKKVLIIASSFAFGRPMALRIRAITELFKACGWKVIVYSDVITLEDKKEYDYTMFNDIKTYGLGRQIKGFKKIVLPFLYKRRISNILEIEKPALVFTNSLYDRFFITRKLVKSCPLILESCEWYDPSTYKYGKFSHHYILHTICWKWGYIHVDGVLAISRLIESHYKKIVKNVIRIPTIVDSINDEARVKVNTSKEKKLRLLFAGSLARTKDSIRPYFEALDILEDYANTIFFDICGVSEEEIINHLGYELYNKYKKQIRVYGKIPQNKIPELYSNCDFGIFFRPNQRSSHAGFSTKLGEGMSCGTPFIVNDTGDISLYIKNGINGYIVKNDKDIANVLKEVLVSSDYERSEMREKALLTAKKYFYFKAYIREFEMFINRVMEG